MTKNLFIFKVHLFTFYIRSAKLGPVGTSQADESPFHTPPSISSGVFCFYLVRPWVCP